MINTENCKEVDYETCAACGFITINGHFTIQEDSWSGLCEVRLYMCPNCGTVKGEY